VKVKRFMATLLGVVLLLAQTLLCHGLEVKKTPLFQHDSNSSLSGPEPGTSEPRITYSNYSGILFLTDNRVLEYVLSSEGFPLTNRSERQGNSGYNLRLSLFDLNQTKARVTKDIAVPGKLFRLFRSQSGDVLLITESGILTMSNELTVLRQTPPNDQLRDSQAWASDVDGAHLYLDADSTEQCPAPVHVLDSESLLPTESWCLNKDRNRAFYGTTAAEYSKGRNPAVFIYRAGKQAGKFDLPRMLFVEQIVLLSDEWLVANDGANFLSYRMGKGIDFYAPVLRHWNIVSPMSCDVSESGCALVIARPKSDVFDVRRTTSLKDAAIAVIGLENGRIQFQCSIQGRYKNLADVRATMSPNGSRVAIWFGSTWEIYSLR